MNTNAINNCSTGKEAPIYTRTIIQFVYMLYLTAYYIMIYSCILMVNAKKTEENDRRVDVASLDVASLDVASLDDNIGFLKPEDVVEEEVLEDDMETLHIHDFEGTGEQLRRLRAYNPKIDGETEEQYEKRILDMTYKEDAEEEEKKKLLSKVVSANEVVLPLENDVNTWYKFEDGKGRYKGEWKNGLPNGKGIKHFYKDDSYIYGNFVDGLADGFCKQTFEQTWEKSQPYYEGEIKRNRYQGKGEYHYGDGDYYKGEWKDGKYHGHGASYLKRLNKTWVGEFYNDEKVEGNWVKGEI